jgi:hypothetical protein
MLWNGVIFRDPLYWQQGEYADASLWVGAGERAVGDLPIAAATYAIATVDNIGVLTLGLGVLGVAIYIGRTRLRAESLAPYPLLSFGAFFVVALFTGQRPLHVPQISGDLYNVRFGLIMLLPVAVFVGYLAGFAERLARRVPALLRLAGHRPVARGVVLGLVLATVLAVPGVTTLTEARSFRASDRQAADARAADWLHSNYNGGQALMMSFGNESVTFDSQVNTASIVYEGSYQLWTAALRDPAAAGIEWIYMRAVPGQEDDVWRSLHASPQLLASYDLVYDQDQRLIYHRKD